MLDRDDRSGRSARGFGVCGGHGWEVFDDSDLSGLGDFASGELEDGEGIQLDVAVFEVIEGDEFLDIDALAGGNGGEGVAGFDFVFAAGGDIGGAGDGGGGGLREGALHRSGREFVGIGRWDLAHDRGGSGLGFFGADEVIDDDAADEDNVDEEHDNEDTCHAAVGFVLVPVTFFGDHGDLVTTAFTAEEVIEEVGAFIFLFWCAHCGYVFGLMCWLG